MSVRTMCLTALAALPLAAVALGAQSMPSISAAKNAATHAANATNAHTEAMQNDGTAPAPAQQATTAAPKTPAVAAAKPAVTMPVKGAQAPAPQSTASAAPAAAKPVTKTVAAAPAKTATAAPAAKGKHTTVPATATGKGAAPAPVAPVGPGPGPTSVSQRGGKNEVSLVREIYNYTPEGRRDPFVSLLMTGELRPMVSDLKLVTVVYDPTGRSVAILRDLTTKEQYRVRVGQTLGRMRVASIQPRTITFTLEELGFSRQETLALNDTTKARSQ